MRTGICIDCGEENLISNLGTCGPCHIFKIDIAVHVRELKEKGILNEDGSLRKDGDL